MSSSILTFYCAASHSSYASHPRSHLCCQNRVKSLAYPAPHLHISSQDFRRVRRLLSSQSTPPYIIVLTPRTRSSVAFFGTELTVSLPHHPTSTSLVNTCVACVLICHGNLLRRISLFLRLAPALSSLFSSVGTTQQFSVNAKTGVTTICDGSSVGQVRMVCVHLPHPLPYICRSNRRCSLLRVHWIEPPYG